MKYFILAVLLTWSASAWADDSCKAFDPGQNVGTCLRSCRASGCDITYSDGTTWCESWCRDHFPVPGDSCQITDTLNVQFQKGGSSVSASVLDGEDIRIEFECRLHGLSHWSCMVTELGPDQMRFGDEDGEDLCSTAKMAYENRK